MAQIYKAAMEDNARLKESKKDKRISELEAEVKELQDLVKRQNSGWGKDHAAVHYLEDEVKALREFRNACVSLTGSLWPQNETTGYLSTLLQDKKG